DHRARGDERRFVERIAERARRDAGEGDALQLVVARQLQAAAVTGRELLRLALVAAAPDRSDGVDDVPRLELVAARDLGVAGLTAAQRAALLDQLGPRPTVNGPVDTAAAQ